MRLHPLLVLALVAPACGGGAIDPHDLVDAGVDAASCADLPTCLRALPGVVQVDELTSQQTGYRTFSLHFTQDVDHHDPSKGTFLEQATLMVTDLNAPMILVNTGYWNFYGQNLSELTQLLHANQLVLEHRYFGSSIPASPDWTELTIENAAGDNHAITQSVKQLFRGKWLETGASKGGMTTMYHRRFWPDDVDGSVPYVAPISFGAPDNRYDAFYQALGTPACRQALQDLEVEMLKNRRAMLESRTSAEATANGYTYTRIAIGPAVESAVQSLYWGFWQYYGIADCPNVPPVTASDDAIWSFLDQYSAPSSSDDDWMNAFQAYDYQAQFQLGYPGTSDTWLTGLITYPASAYDGGYPVGVTIPTYDGGTAMNDVDGWVQSQGAHLLFVYGGWDPWSGGQFTLGNATDASLHLVPEGTHGSEISGLVGADQTDAYAKLAAWTGVTPDPSAVHGLRALEAVRPPRVPPAILQAWRLRHPSR